jgi:hypothetical protein
MINHFADYVFWNCMISKASKQELKIVFVAKLGAMTPDKFHVIIPKQFNDKIRNLRGKQVKIILDDEL